MICRSLLTSNRAGGFLLSQGLRTTSSMRPIGGAGLLYQDADTKFGMHNICSSIDVSAAGVASVRLG